MLINILNLCICFIIHLIKALVKVWTKETWNAGNFIIAQMVRGLLDTEEQMKSNNGGHVQPH